MALGKINLMFKEKKSQHIIRKYSIPKKNNTLQNNNTEILKKIIHFHGGDNDGKQQVYSLV